MKRLVFRIPVALITFAVGVAAAHLCFEPPTSVIYQIKKPPIVSQFSFSSAPQFSFSNRIQFSGPDQSDASMLLNKICMPTDSLEYKGFEVSRSYEPKTEKSSVTIKKGGKVLAVNNVKSVLADKESSCFGLYPALGRETKQLIIVQTTGGAHCCLVYRIYDFEPKLHLIFDSEKYPVGDGFDELKFVDIDGDGVMEFTQRDMTFDYWQGLAYTASPHPEVVFQYDRKAKKYYPAKRKFAGYLLKGIEEEIGNLDKEDPYQDLANELDITLRYIYAGKEKQAWRFFDKEYGLKTGLENEMKSQKFQIKKALKGDPVYRFIYGH